MFILSLPLMQMYRYFFLLISFLFFAFSLQAQVPWAVQPPKVDWIRAIGGLSTQKIYGSVGDAAGNVYLCGYFSDILEVDTIFSYTNMGHTEAFIMKIDSFGQVVWFKHSTTMGATENTTIDCRNLYIDDQGILYAQGTASNVQGVVWDGDTLYKHPDASFLNFIFAFNNEGTITSRFHVHQLATAPTIGFGEPHIYQDRVYINMSGVRLMPFTFAGRADTCRGYTILVFDREGNELDHIAGTFRHNGKIVFGGISFKFSDESGNLFLDCRPFNYGIDTVFDKIPLPLELTFNGKKTVITKDEDMFSLYCTDSNFAPRWIHYFYRNGKSFYNTPDEFEFVGINTIGKDLLIWATLNGQMNVFDSILTTSDSKYIEYVMLLLDVTTKHIKWLRQDPGRYRATAATLGFSTSSIGADGAFRLPFILRDVNADCQEMLNDYQPIENYQLILNKHRANCECIWQRAMFSDPPNKSLKVKYGTKHISSPANNYYLIQGIQYLYDTIWVDDYAWNVNLPWYTEYGLMRLRDDHYSPPPVPAADEAVRIFPNPGRETIFFTLPEGETAQRVTAYAPTGQQVFTASLADAGIPGRIDLPPALAAGVYFLVFETASGFNAIPWQCAP